MEVLPASNVPMDYSALTIGELYHALGESEKGDDVLDQIAANTVTNINWFFRLNPRQLASVETDLRRELSILNEILRIAKQHNSKLVEKYQESFDNFRMAYSPNR